MERWYGTRQVIRIERLDNGTLGWLQALYRESRKAVMAEGQTLSGPLFK